MSKFQNIQETIREILLSNPGARDDDFQLASLYAQKNYPKGVPSFTRVLVDMKSGNMPGFDTITRLRRKLQQHYPVLRGADYKRRKNIMQPKVAQDMNTFVVTGSGIVEQGVLF